MLLSRFWVSSLLAGHAETAHTSSSSKICFRTQGAGAVVISTLRLSLALRINGFGFHLFPANS